MNRSFVSLLWFVAASWVFVQLNDEKQMIRFCEHWCVILCAALLKYGDKLGKFSGGTGTIRSIQPQGRR